MRNFKDLGPLLKDNVKKEGIFAVYDLNINFLDEKYPTQLRATLLSHESM